MSKVATENKPEPIRQIFQGRTPRDEANFLQKLTYSYIWPLLESMMTQYPHLEQYGKVPERDTIS